MLKKVAVRVAFVAGFVVMVVDATPLGWLVTEAEGRLAAVSAILSGGHLMLWSSPVVQVWNLAYEKATRDTLRKVNQRAVTPLPLAASDGWRARD